MAGFSAAGLNKIAQAGGGGPQLWIYYTATDAHATVEGSDYFAGMASPASNNYGMKAGDIVIVVDDNANTCTIHFVQTVDADGNVTVNAATLS